MKFDNEFKNKVENSLSDMIDNFQNEQWPKIKEVIDEASENTVEFSKKHGKKLAQKSKKTFKEGVRALDQWVNGSSVHRDK